jgi:hypothetical protein
MASIRTTQRTSGSSTVQACLSHIQPLQQTQSNQFTLLASLTLKLRLPIAIFAFDVDNAVTIARLAEGVRTFTHITLHRHVPPAPAINRALAVAVSAVAESVSLELRQLRPLHRPMVVGFGGWRIRISACLLDGTGKCEMWSDHVRMMATYQAGQSL